MKLRWEYNISKQFQSISCLTCWLRAHFPPSKILIWGRISIFDTKNLISRYFSTFQLPNHLHLQKMSKIQLYSYGKIQAKQIWLLKYTKTCPKLAVFGHFLIFSVFDGNFLRTLNPKSALLFIKCGIKYPKWPIHAKSVHKTEISNLTKNEIVPHSKHGGGERGVVSVWSEQHWMQMLLDLSRPSCTLPIEWKLHTKNWFFLWKSAVILDRLE